MKNIFATPMIVEDLEIDNDLLAGCLAQISEIKPRGTVNRLTTATGHNAWQSENGVFELGGALSDMRTIILSRVSAFIEQYEAILGGPAFERDLDIESWAVELPTGCFQSEHTHSRRDFVAVFILQNPDDSAGNLCLCDPRPGRLASRPQWEPDHIAIPAKPKRLVIFPAFLPHRVSQVGAGTRISLNCDIALRRRS